MTKPFTGEVLWITLTPGRTDTLMLSVSCPKVGEHHVTFSVADLVTIRGFTDGIPGPVIIRDVNVAALFHWLAYNPRPIVTVTPDPDRFGFSKRTEFRPPGTTPA